MYVCVVNARTPLWYFPKAKKKSSYDLLFSKPSLIPSILLPRTDTLTSKEGVLITEVLAAVRLTEANDTRGIKAACLGCATSCDTEAKGDISHAVDDDTGVLGAVLGPTADVGLDDCFQMLVSFHHEVIRTENQEMERYTVRAVEEGLGTVVLDPDLMTGVLGEDRNYKVGNQVVSSQINPNCLGNRITIRHWTWNIRAVM